jgi:hypothetical protein
LSLGKSQPVWYLADLVHPSATESTLFAMLKFYMDESGIGKNPDERVCSVAGFVAQSSAWRGFQKQWLEILEDYSIDEFHSKEFWARHTDGGLAGKYRTWSFDRANKFITNLAELIVSYNPYLLGSVIKLSDFFSYQLKQRQYLTGADYRVDTRKFITSGKPKAAYFVPFQVVTIKGLELGTSIGEKCHFVFDEQNEFSPLAATRIAEMKRFPDNSHFLKYWGDTVFSNSVTVHPLQAADLATFCCKEYYKCKMYGTPLILGGRAVKTPLEVFRFLLEELKPKVKLFDLEKKEMDNLLSRSRLE